MPERAKKVKYEIIEKYFSFFYVFFQSKERTKNIFKGWERKNYHGKEKWIVLPKKKAIDFVFAGQK